VENVLANTYGEFDVVVIDQSDDDRTAVAVRALESNHPNLRYVFSATPGLSRAYNAGVRATTGEVLAFTDDDCVAHHTWLATIARAFAADPDAEMLYGQVLVPAALADRLEQVPNLPFDRPRRFSRKDGFQIIGMGANFATRRRLFDRIGGFDEMLGGGGVLRSSQDFDLQYRAFIAGAVTLLDPEVKVDHYGIRDWDQWPTMMRAYGTGDGAFYSKHVRCGDLRALGLMAKQFGRIAVREALLRLNIRPRPSQSGYLHGCLDGIRAGMRVPVDRRSRLYRTPEQAMAGAA
jgi:GT2 family glycosyltransferase